MKQILTPLWCITASAFLSLTGMETSKTVKSAPSQNQREKTLIARSKNRVLGIVQSPSDKKPFSLYKAARGGTSFPLYSKSLVYPVGDLFAVHTTRGICITSEGFAIFDKSAEIMILAAAQKQYATIFSDPHALNSLITQLSLSMPTDTTAIIASLYGAYVYDLTTDSCIQYLPPCAIAEKEIKMAHLSKSSEGYTMPHFPLIYIAATQKFVGFLNPVSERYPNTTQTTVAQKIVQENPAIDYVGYAKSHEKSDTFAFGNGSELIISHLGAQHKTTAKKLVNDEEMLISALDFTPETTTIVIALNDRKHERLSRIITCSPEMRTILFITIQGVVSDINELQTMTDGTLTVWTTRRAINISTTNGAQGRQQSSQHS